MRNRFDQLAKQIGKAALGPSGHTSSHDEISPETQHADLRHEPDSARRVERDRLGLLGRIAAALCLIEIYSHAPSTDEFRACLAKHLAFWQLRARQTRAARKQRPQQRRPRQVFVEPALWIIAAGTPTALLRKLELGAARGWPTGVYFFGADVLRVGLVVASQLPRERSTLLVRLMAAGPLLTQAIEDLAELPQDAHERAVAEHILLDLQHALEQQPRRHPKEQEFIVTMRRSWEDARLEGRTETRADAVLTVLRVRGIAVPAAVRKRILAEKDLQQLACWLERAIVAASLDEVLDGRAAHPPSRARRPAAPKERGGRRLARVHAHR
ncbi:MAG TPA: hypothetical protein VN253_10555 [Kofleriaceae bacterium]|nr:hypothetical protein [Kofleriaceae bacterium]